MMMSKKSINPPPPVLNPRFLAMRVDVVGSSERDFSSEHTKVPQGPKPMVKAQVS